MPCELYYSDDDLLPGDLCPIHQRPVETVEEENYFFKLSRFEDRLLEWYDQHPDAIVPDFRANEVRGLIKGGLRDFSISRTSLTWGIPLPWDDKHVTYVWFDALTNYIAAVGYGSDPERFEQWWPVDYHLIGKDIIRQHCVYWPAMLLSAGHRAAARLGGRRMVARRRGQDVEDRRQRGRSARPDRRRRRRRVPLLRRSPPRRTATTATSATRA